jgi:metal-responsive CopG/Arc/MetJ family transcriptional regulator
MDLMRVTVTIPASLLAQLDRRAGMLDRSRSWCVAEAVRRFVADDTSRQPPPGSPT